MVTYNSNFSLLFAKFTLYLDKYPNITIFKPFNVGAEIDVILK